MTSDREPSRRPRRARGQGRILRCYREALRSKQTPYNHDRLPIPNRRQRIDMVRGLWSARRVFAVVSSRAWQRIISYG